MAVKILIADDHEIVRQGIRRVLEAKPEWQICGEAANGQEAVRMAQELAPDVIIMDVTMPVMNGFEAAERLRDMKCKTKIVILTTYEDDEYIHAAFSAGANAYVAKRYFGTDLVTAIRQVVRGDTFVSPSLLS